MYIRYVKQCVIILSFTSGKMKISQKCEVNTSMHTISLQCFIVCSMIL